MYGDIFIVLIRYLTSYQTLHRDLAAWALAKEVATLIMVIWSDVIACVFTYFPNKYLFVSTVMVGFFFLFERKWDIEIWRQTLYKLFLKHLVQLINCYRLVNNVYNEYMIDLLFLRLYLCNNVSSAALDVNSSYSIIHHCNGVSSHSK